MGGRSRELYNGVGTLIDKFIAGMSSEGGQVVQTGQGRRAGRYKIGDTGPGGGIVFVVEADGNSGMEVSRLLGSADSWRNARDIIKNYRGGGMNDWRLPSKDELNFIYKNLVQAEGIRLVTNNSVDTRDYYWSSTTDWYFHAWIQNLRSGGQTVSKGNTYSVCAVRVF